MKNLSKTIGLVVVFSIFLACFNEQDYDLVNPKDLLNIESHIQTAKADGADIVNVTITLNPKIEKSKKIVILKTSLGTFISGKGDSIVLKEDDQLKFTGQLVSTKIGQASLSAKIGNYVVKDENQVTFTRAYPVQISASVDSFAIKSNFQNELKITASMRSERGIPTQGQKVIFGGFTSDGTPIGEFLNGVNSSSSDVNGNATIRFAVGPTIYRGKITIKVETQKEDGAVITGSTIIHLID